MQGWLIVRDDPWASVTDDQGRFELPALPAGSWRLRFWHEGDPLVGLTVGDRETDERGEIIVEIAANGGTELGDIEVPIARLEN